jgi:hypothetical protein
MLCTERLVRFHSAMCQLDRDAWLSTIKDRTLGSLAPKNLIRVKKV